MNPHQADSILVLRVAVSGDRVMEHSPYCFLHSLEVVLVVPDGTTIEQLELVNDLVR